VAGSLVPIQPTVSRYQATLPPAAQDWPSENGDNEGLIEINGSTVATSGRLWAFANYSRFVRPGGVRIGASSANGSLEVAAQAAIPVQHGSFTATLPPRSLVTYDILAGL
jgi:hypothetical protein